jgi:hypothetical protein
MASTAEASNTILLTLRGLPPFGDQFLNQRGTRFYMPPDEALSSLDALFQSHDAQFVIFDAQDNFIANVDA